MQRSPAFGGMKGFQGFPALRQGSLQQAFAVGRNQAVEQHELGRRLRRQFLDAALGRMKAQLQSFEGEHAADRDDQLSIHQQPLGLQDRKSKRLNSSN